MTELAAPVAYALFAWWFGTGLVLLLDGLPRRTYGASMLVATVALAGAFAGLAGSADDSTPAGAYTAFTCAIVVWCWLEMSFLMGFVTGPRSDPLPAGWTGTRRFTRAVQAILYHEAAILVSGTAVIALTWSAANPVGGWTFVVLWTMRVSAKLNLFLGVRNTGEELLPPQLAHLGSFFRRRPMNWLMPFSLALPAAVAGALVEPAFAANATAFDVVSRLLAGTLLALAVLEHAFMVLPIQSSFLWGLGPRGRTAAAERER